MTPREAFRTALDNLAAHKLRSALTMLGMIFGVGAVIAMLAIGAGAEAQALGMIERLGLRTWAPGEKPHWLRIRSTVVSGRRIVTGP